MGIWSELDLRPDRHRLIALVGGGGKTTTLYALAAEAAAEGWRVVVTTTTHIMPHPRLPLTDDSAALPALLAAGHRVVTLGRWSRRDKLSGAVPPAALAGLADVVLAEADGARLLPLKVPAPHEPVIPPGADAVVAVAGLDSLGEPVAKVCHRPERVCALLGVPPEHRVSPADAAEILASPLGGRKNVPAGAAFRCLLNKADTAERRAEGEVIKGLLAARGISAAVHSYGEKERGGLCWF